MKKILLGIILGLSLSINVFSQDYKVVGYIPSYSPLFSDATIVPYTKVTHINVAFLNPTDATGANVNFSSSTSSTRLTNLITQSHQNSVKIAISLAGALDGTSTAYGYLNTIISDNTLRATFENRIIKFLNDYNLDGLDIDIETDLLSTLCTNGSYPKFITELKAKLPVGKTLTVALGTGYYANFVPKSTLQVFDWINVMSYDKYGTWTGIGQHSSYNDFVTDENYYLNTRGIDYGKIVMGMPFYGYGWGPYKTGASFAYIVSLSNSAITTDYYKDPNTLMEYYYNGTATILKKTQEVYNQGMAGIMIWELGQDAEAPNSLLDVIHTVIPLAAHDELLNSSSIIVYPNPAKTRLFIEGKEAGTYLINNIEGKTITSGQLTDDFTKEIPLEHMQSGVYIFKFSSNRETIIKKIIIE